MDFVALDIETANADYSSICQIGVARFEEGGCLVEEWATLVNPEDYFDPVNTSIHGITEDAVRGAPTFLKLSGKLRGWLKNNIVVCHTPFDRVVVAQACWKYHLPEIQCTWLDTACVARRAWTEFARSGYGLQNVCAAIGYSFTGHDALAGCGKSR